MISFPSPLVARFIRNYGIARVNHPGCYAELPSSEGRRDVEKYDRNQSLSVPPARPGAPTD